MDLKYRGRTFTDQDISRINEILGAHPGRSRRALSKIVCEEFDWRQENGQLRDMVCRGAMLALHRDGRISLPPQKMRPKNNVILHRTAQTVLIDQTPIAASLSDLGAIELHQVRKTADERLVDGLIEAHHYLGYTRPVGEQIKYLFIAQGRPIGCAAWSSAPRHLSPRDRFIGWSMEARKRNVRLLAYNTRFLILPWVRVPHLASHVLGRMARGISRDWEKAYSHGIVYLETFTDPSRFKGTCYRAANWIFLGKTTGRGNNAPTMEVRVPIKEILGYPLSQKFRQVLGNVS